ncbi:MAG: uracil-DNA glycosylase, partial [Moraxellaceae bacterium]
MASDQDEAALERVKLDPSWKAPLSDMLLSPTMTQLRDFLAVQKHEHQIIYPPSPLIFNALNTTPLDQVRVVILGQDPYHGPNQANGLSFS